MKLIKSLLPVIAVLLLCSGAFAEAPVFMVDGKQVTLDSAVVGESGHVMAALRDLEGLGWGKIGFSGGETTFTDGKVTLSFAKNSRSAKLNSLSVSLPVSTYLANSKLMVPVSFVAKSMGYGYETRKATIVNVTREGTVVKPSAQTSGQTAPAAQAQQPAQPVKEPAPAAATSGTGSTGKNWFQGAVAYNGKRIQGVKLTLRTDPGGKVLKTETTDKDGAFKFYNIPDGKYQIVIDNKDNENYRTMSFGGFAISGGAAKKLNKPINLVLALNNCQVTKEGDSYVVKWSNVNNVKFYKLSTSCANSKAKTPVYTSTKNQVTIPASELSKGQIYQLKLIAVTAANLTIGQSNGKNWVLSTQN